MDLLSKLNSNTKSKAIEPREIFMTLPSKASGYGYPRDVQSEVWKKWFDIRNNRNVILKMNTGSGKTVVGLMILQSCLNEGRGPAIYAVPDNFLVEQVTQEAKRLGIAVTENKDDYAYTNSKAILVTNIQSIVNGHSAFGMRDSGRNYPIGSIIVDDVHACMDKIVSQFMIRIASDSSIYSEIIDVFRDALKDYDPRNYVDVVEIRDNRKTILVPYWEWQRHVTDIYRILCKSNDAEKCPEIYFGLPLIERTLETCDCFITASSIEISPKGVDIAKITSFETAERRIFMSATLSDDSVFVSALGLKEEDMENIITPENANDIGDRLVLFPTHINGGIMDEEIKVKVEEIAQHYNVVILVPSYSRAKFWDPDSCCTINRDNINSAITCIREGKYIGKIVIVNRYDGIDLPGDACRMLVIDGLPPLNCIKDRYIQSVDPQSTILLREQVQRIEQGMGRGVRSNDDQCCIVLMGAELSDVLTRNSGLEFFSVATRAQYDLSKNLWDLLVEEEAEPNVNRIFELAKYSLEKNPEWIKMCKECLATVRYTSVPNVDKTIFAMRKAFEYSLNGQWEEAALKIKSIKDLEKERTTKGYLCQVQAEYTNKYDSAESQQILKAGRSLSGAVLAPIEGIQYQRLANGVQQAQAIHQFLIEINLSSNELLLRMNSVLSNLVFGSEFNKFEEALRVVGLALGFSSSRPDKETRGEGPDNLWAIDEKNYLVIECKTGASTDTITKDYCNQLSGSVNWFKKEYMSTNFCHPIMIHPSKRIDRLASPVDGMRIITEAELARFRGNVRSLYTAIANNANSRDISIIAELIKMYKLRAEDIVNEYTVSV